MCSSSRAPHRRSSSSRPSRSSARTPAPRRRLGQVVADLGLAAERDVAKALADLLGLTSSTSRGCSPRPTSSGSSPARSPSAPACWCSTGRRTAWSSPPPTRRTCSRSTTSSSTPAPPSCRSSSRPTARSATRSRARGRIQHDCARRLGDGRRPSTRTTTSGQALADIPSAPRTRPIVKLVNQILADAVHLRRLRHPPRGAARRAAGPLPRRRPAARRHERPRSGSRPRSSAASRSSRVSTSPSGAFPQDGRTRFSRRRPRHRRPCLDPALAARREGRDPAAHPR